MLYEFHEKPDASDQLEIIYFAKPTENNVYCDNSAWVNCIEPFSFIFIWLCLDMFSTSATHNKYFGVFDNSHLGAMTFDMVYLKPNC